MQKFCVPILIALAILTGCTRSSGPEGSEQDQIAKGRILFRDLGCATCHSVSGQPGYGPSLDTILNKKVQVIRDGKIRVLTIGRRYITKAIQDPSYEKVSQFSERAMPVPAISGKDIECLVDFIIHINKKKAVH